MYHVVCLFNRAFVGNRSATVHAPVAQQRQGSSPCYGALPTGASAVFPVQSDVSRCYRTAKQLDISLTLSWH